MQIPLHPGVPTARYSEKKHVQVDGPVPLIDGKTNESRVQEIWRPKSRQFVLADNEQREALDEIWAKIASGAYTYSEMDKDYQSTWSERLQSFVVYLRWVELEYVAPAPT